MHRLLTTAAAAIGLAALASSCATTNPVAAKVNGTVITQRTVERQLRDLVKAKAAIGTGTTSTAASGATLGTANGAFARLWVDRLVRLQLVHAEVQRRQIALTADDRTTGQTEAQQLFQSTPAADGSAPATPTSVLDAMPKAFRDDLANRLAEEAALGRTLTTKPITAGVVREVLKNGRDLVCVRVLPIASAQDAASVLGQISGGADMAQLADAAFAGASGTPKGGLVVGSDGACPAIGQLRQDFATELGGLEIGKANGPLTLGSNILIVRVEQVQVEPIAQFLIAAQKKGTISIDPRYGRFDPDVGVVAIDAAPAAPAITQG